MFFLWVPPSYPFTKGDPDVIRDVSSWGPAKTPLVTVVEEDHQIIIFHYGSMGLVYLPTWMVVFYGILVSRQIFL